MKKIKRKSKSTRARKPGFVIGYVGATPAAGFLAAWYNQEYGGPLHIRFPNSQSNSAIEVSHLDWIADIQLESSFEEVSQFRDQLGWDHKGATQVFPASKIGVSRIDAILFVARLSRGLTLLTEGTAYDVVSGLYRNPSDWSDRQLTDFRIDDHVHVHQEESLDDGRQWFVTRGMGKFGLEELEVFRPCGLSERPTHERLLDLSHVCVLQGKSPKVGALLHLPDCENVVRVVKHRTMAASIGQLNVREVCWD